MKGQLIDFVVEKEGSACIDFRLVITPATPPSDRHKIEDALKVCGYKVSGGGQWVDGTESDISFERDDPRDKD